MPVPVVLVASVEGTATLPAEKRRLPQRPALPETAATRQPYNPGRSTPQALRVAFSHNHRLYPC
jgi:hypothetical protein